MTLEVETNPLYSQNRALDAEKRQAILDAARALFTTKGYESTTMAEVAKQAGVAVGTLYVYFKNKSELLYAVKGDWEQQFLSFMARPEIEAIPHHLRARPFIEASFAICEQHIEMVHLMGMLPELVGGWYAQDHGLVARALEGMIEEGIAAGAFRQLDSKATAIIAYGMVNQALIQCFLHEGGQDQQRYIDALVDALEHLFLK